VIIQKRVRVRVPTPGSQRRCYDGCFHPDDWYFQWTEWTDLETTDNPDRIKFWKDLNDYAVSARGESARAEFRIVGT